MRRWPLRILPLLIVLIAIASALVIPGTATTESLVIRSEEGETEVRDPSALRAFYRRSEVPEPESKGDPVTLTITHRLKSGLTRSETLHLDRDAGVLWSDEGATEVPSFFISDDFAYLYEPPTLEPLRLIAGGDKHSLPTSRGDLSYRVMPDGWLRLELMSEILEAPYALASDQSPTIVSDATGGTLWIDGEQKTWSVDQALPLPEEEGTYRIKIAFHYDLPGLRGTRESHFDVRVDRPASFTLQKTSLERGEMITLAVDHLNEGEIPYLELPFGSSRFYGEGSSRVARLAASYHDTPGTYTLVYGIEGGVRHEEEISLEPGTFEIQHLWIDPTVASNTRNEAAYKEYNMYFPPARSESDARDLTGGRFVLPVEGRLSTSFGETRYVNGSPTSYRHSGIDIAAPTGTPVGALAGGRITLSRHFILTGNTVVIDHGRGLFSVYFHLHTLDASAGDLVEAGEPIGTVGSTGFSTGPHLHLTTSYFDKNIAPGRLLYGEVLTYENYQELFNRTEEGPANES